MDRVIEVRNKADMLIASTEKTLKEHPDKVTEEEKKSIEEAIEELKKSKDSEDKKIIEETMEKLAKVSQKLAEEIYKDAQAKQSGSAEAQPGQQQEAKKADDDVEDAEVVD